MGHSLKYLAVQGGFCISAILFSLSLAWLVLKPIDFLYPVWHDYAGIGEGIDRYAPQNKYKPGFAATSAEERYQLFADINRAIHSSGDGLAEIYYQTATSGGPQQLLRQPEQVHLQDVANLVDFMRWVVIINAVLFVTLLVLILKLPMRLLVWRGQLVGMLGFSGGLVCLLLVFSPKTVFNQLHIWIFPENHQWFFYYQESLMSTMMVAPNLFGWIALALGLLACVIYVALVSVLALFERRRKGS